MGREGGNQCCMYKRQGGTLSHIPADSTPCKNRNRNKRWNRTYGANVRCDITKPHCVLHPANTNRVQTTMYKGTVKRVSFCMVRKEEQWHGLSLFGRHDVSSTKARNSCDRHAYDESAVPFDSGP